MIVLEVVGALFILLGAVGVGVALGEAACVC
jgi:hypothetical protein